MRLECESHNVAVRAQEELAAVFMPLPLRNDLHVDSVRAKNLAPPIRSVNFTLRVEHGVLAQLVERLNGIEEVRGSNPLGSTSFRWWSGRLGRIRTPFDRPPRLH